ncbi:MAG: hypothetical protein JKY67_07585 [Pseudomonadales bacterium]|nr:hypothetical protein [Pseudomonadales bacterium]
MLELRRQAYLDSFGIDSWFPRAEILGAKPSPVLSIDDQLMWSDQQEVQRSKPVPADQVLGTEVPVKQVLAKQVPTKQVLPQQAPTTQASAPQINSQSDIATPFALTFELIGGETLFVAELQDPLAPDYSAQEYRLKKDILFALGLENTGTEIFQFFWPIVKNQQLNYTCDDASQAVAGMMHARFGAQMRFERVILLGSNAAEILLGRHGEIDQMLCEDNPKARGAEWGVKTMVSHRLADMLEQPLLKKHLLSRIVTMMNTPVINSTATDGV